MKKLLFILLLLGLQTAFAAKPKHSYVRLKTPQGECIIMLYNSTPLHRDNFIRLVKKGFYDSTLFHRVIRSFMIQGGDPDSKTALAGAELGNGDVGYTIPAEFRDSIFHKKGVLAAARDDNPKMASSGCQFYLVQGKKYSSEQLDSMEVNRLHYKIPAWKREVYKTSGGTPHLDNKYTAYGEVVRGIELIDSIAVKPTDKNDRPLADVKMSMVLLRKREARKLEKQLKKENPANLFILNQ